MRKTKMMMIMDMNIKNEEERVEEKREVEMKKNRMNRILMILKKMVIKRITNMKYILMMKLS